MSTIKILFILLFASVFSLPCEAQDEYSEIPFRSKEGYTLELDYDFRKKPPPPANTIQMDDIIKPKVRGIQPYITVFLSIHDLGQGEHRVRIHEFPDKHTNRFRLKGKPLEIELGFADELKSGEVNNRFIMLVENKDKEFLNRIEILIKEDGTFMLNDAVNGKL